MDFYEYFINDNKSGYKTRRGWLIKNNKQLYDNILSHCSEELKNLTLKEQIWCFINGVKNMPRCECGNKLKFKKSLRDGYGKYCSIKCTNKSKAHKLKVKKTNEKKYGGVSPSHSDDIKNKIKKTNLKKYGVDNIFKDVEYIKKKTLEKHGVEHISQLMSTKISIAETNLKKYGVTTPLKNKDIRQCGFYKKKINFKEKYKTLEILNVVGNDIHIKCPSCYNNYSINRSVLYHRYLLTSNPCTICHPKKSGVSIGEKQLRDFIISLGMPFEENFRKLIPPLEVDIYIPSKNIAIEYNGIYWHSELYVDKDYHLNKTELCNDKGVKLIHIFEDEWVNKQDIVKSRLKNLFGLTKGRIYARKCEVKEVLTKDKTKFLNENHIQGAVGSKYNLGLYYEDELVSIMTFGAYRKVLGLNSKKDNYELIRFCNKIDLTVIGGASKLFKNFIRGYDPKEIISYADRRWSTGNLYDVLGFKFSHNSNPNYFYIVNGLRHHRFKYRKDLLIKDGFNKELTEREIMLKRKIYRIYDCGTITYKFKVFS